MKKILTLALLLMFSLTIAGCAKDILKKDGYDYYVLLNGEGLKVESNKMEAISYIDKRVKPLRKEFKKSLALYVFEVEVTEGDKLSIARIATNVETSTPDYIAQDKQSGPIKNLTESTLLIPEYTEFDNGNGTWESECTIKTTGKVVIVFSEEANNVKCLGVITK